MELRTLIIIDIVLVILGVILIALGGGLIPFFDWKIRNTVIESVKLVNGSEAYDSWKEPRAPIYLSFNFFNVTNFDAVVNGGATPTLEEFGPFTYREYRNKTNITFTESGEKIRYREHKYYVFDREKSDHNESLVICTLNIPILTIATEMRYSSKFFQKFLAYVLAMFGEGLFQCHSVKELLWGYTPKAVEDINKMLEAFGIHYRVNYTFGIYSGPTANGTDDGEIVINSGVKNVNNLGQVEDWRGNSTLPFWHDYCNKINGSDGTLWHPYIEKTERLYIFNTDLFRSLYVTYNASTSVSSSNIATYRFLPPQSVMANHSENPDNLCYCSPYDVNGNYCLGAGVLNVSICRDNAPIIMSEPHFLEAPDYQNEVNGLHPDPAKHQTILDVEPITGLVMNAAKRVQVNMFVTQLDGLIDTKKIKKDGIIFPVSWVDEHATIPDDVAAEFYRTLFVPMKVADGIKYGLIALGGFILLCAIVVLIVILVKRRNEKDVTALSPDESESLLNNEES